MGKMNLTIVDHDGETSSVGVLTPDLTAGNFAATVAEMDALQDAIEAVIIGTPRGRTIVAVTEEIAGVLPNNGFAQRETKWLVQGVDANGQARTLEIPTANLDLLSAGTGNLDVSAGVGLALKNALDGIWVTSTGAAVTVASIIHVGRNL